MQETTAFPWGVLFTLMLSVGGVFAAVFLVIKAAEWLSLARDELRGRYADERWKPISLDWLGFPLWLALELICIAGGIVFMLFTLWMVYDTARGFRDWWHAGGRDQHGR